MTNADTVHTAYPATTIDASGATRTYYRYVLKTGHKVRTVEQWCLGQKHAEERAQVVAEDGWYRTATGPAKVLHVYPVPAGIDDAGRLNYTGGP